MPKTPLFYLWEIFINYLVTSLYVIYVRTHFKEKCRLPHYRLFMGLFFAGWIALLSFFNLSGVSTPFTLSFYLIVSIVFTLCFFQGSLISRIFWSVLFTPLTLVAEYITFTIPILFIGASASDILMGGSLRMPFTLLYISLIASMVFLLANVFRKAIRLSLPQKLAYCSLSLAGIAISHYILILTLRLSLTEEASAFAKALTWVNLFYLFMFLSMLFFIYQLGQSQEEKIQLQQQMQQLALEEQQYRLLLESTDTLRTIKHDIHLHMDTIQSLIHQREQPAFQEYTREYYHSLEGVHQLFHTGNAAVDCIFSSRFSRAHQLQIPITHEAVIPMPFPMPDVALASLLGNLLDNSIEACQRIMAEEGQGLSPFIRLVIKPFKDMVLIHLTNSYLDVQRHPTAGHFLSSKHGPEHGWGIKRIQSLVEQHDGICLISAENNVFSVQILIPLQKEALCS